MIKNIFIKLINYVECNGELEKAAFYDEDFASIDFKKDDKSYSITIRCEKVNTDANNGN